MDAESFWKKVKMLLSERGVNQDWLCEKTGIILGTLRNKISLGRLPSFDEALKIVEAFGMTMEEFKAYPDIPAKDVINIPVYEQALSAGRGQELPDSAEIMDWVALPSHLKKYSASMSVLTFAVIPWSQLFLMMISSFLIALVMMALMESTLSTIRVPAL